MTSILKRDPRESRPPDNADMTCIGHGAGSSRADSSRRAAQSMLKAALQGAAAGGAYRSGKLCGCHEGVSTLGWAFGGSFHQAARTRTQAQKKETGGSDWYPPVPVRHRPTRAPHSPKGTLATWPVPQPVRFSEPPQSGRPSGVRLGALKARLRYLNDAKPVRPGVCGNLFHMARELVIAAGDRRRSKQTWVTPPRKANPGVSFYVSSGCCPTRTAAKIARIVLPWPPRYNVCRQPRFCGL